MVTVLLIDPYAYARVCVCAYNGVMRKCLTIHHWSLEVALMTNQWKRRSTPRAPVP